jgi:hypothetical protein
MAFPRRRVALSRAAVAAIVGMMWVALGGLEVAIPALALVAIVYWSHDLLATLAGDEGVPHPDLALVIVVNSAVVLMVQALLFAANLEAF